jgi:hypothetical protein
VGHSGYSDRGCLGNHLCVCSHPEFGGSDCRRLHECKGVWHPCAASVPITLTPSISDSLSGMRTSAYSSTDFDRSQMSITLLGLIQLARGRATTSLTTSVFDGTSTSPSAYALALYSGLWAFDGWDQANYVGGEMSEPEKNIPRVIHSSMITVTVRPLLSPTLKCLDVVCSYCFYLPMSLTS